MQLAEGSESWCCAYVRTRDAALVGGCGSIAVGGVLAVVKAFQPLEVQTYSSSESERCRRRGAAFKLFKASPTDTGFACQML